MAYCPNCSSVVDENAAACAACGATFGPEGAWRPLVEAPKARASWLAVPATRTAAAVSAFLAAMAFLLAGKLVLSFLFGLSGPIWFILTLSVLAAATRLSFRRGGHALSIAIGVLAALVYAVFISYALSHVSR